MNRKKLIYSFPDDFLDPQYPTGACYIERPLSFSWEDHPHDPRPFRDRSNSAPVIPAQAMVQREFGRELQRIGDEFQSLRNNQVICSPQVIFHAQTVITMLKRHLYDFIQHVITMVIEESRLEEFSQINFTRVESVPKQVRKYVWSSIL